MKTLSQAKSGIRTQGNPQNWWQRWDLSLSLHRIVLEGVQEDLAGTQILSARLAATPASTEEKLDPQHDYLPK